MRFMCLILWCKTRLRVVAALPTSTLPSTWEWARSHLGPNVIDDAEVAYMHVIMMVMTECLAKDVERSSESVQ